MKSIKFYRYQWVLLAVLFSLLLYPHLVSGKITTKIPQAQPRLAGTVSQVYIEHIEPPVIVTRLAPKTSNTVIGTGRGCVLYLRTRGYPVPQNPMIASKYLPVDSIELPPEGVEVLIVTYESVDGHVSRAVNRGGVLTTTVDSAGAGRVIPPSVYKGYLFAS